MADNYLERRMDDMRSGRLSRSEAAALRRKKLRPRPLAGVCVIVAGTSGCMVPETVEVLKRLGASVDVVGIDRAEGNALAQRYGARYVPADLSDINETLEAVRGITAFRGYTDLLITDADQDVCQKTLSSLARVIRVETVTCPEDAVTSASRILSCREGGGG